MKSFVRFGKRISIPSTFQVKHELRKLIADENTRELCAQAEGLLPAASWNEICAARARAAQ